MSTPLGNEIDRLRLACEKLVSTIEATGGLEQSESDRQAVPCGDTEWIDLADAYLAACAALGREPLIQVLDDV